MLINRTTMERMGVSVNPQKTFIVTYFDGYSAKTAKTEKYHSIKFKK
jgi:hypothetical protein